jgi:uncharacterized membrane protein
MRFLKHFWRLLILWFVLGMCYVTLELIFRGYTYRQMIWIGGLAGLLIGLLNQHRAYYNRLMWQQCFLGTLITLAVEFAGGCIFNLWLHLKIWDYSSMPFNLYGQICLQMAAEWFFLMPLAVYLDDWLRWKLFNETPPIGGLLTNYIALFKGK